MQLPEWLQNDYDYSGPKTNIPEEPFVSDILIHWAKTLPDSPFGIIDLAAGGGYEAWALTRAGFATIAHDIAPTSADHSYATQARIGTLTHLEFPNRSFGGAILKDTLCILSPEKRSVMFSELSRTLVPGGQFILFSEHEDTDHAVLSIRSPFFYVDTFSRGWDEPTESWERRIIEAAAEYENAELYFANDPEQIRSLADEHGLKRNLHTEYPVEHPLVRQNRWKRNTRPYYVSVFEKSSSSMSG